MLTCIRCKGQIPKGKLTVATRFLPLFRTYHDSCFADVVRQEGAVFERGRILNSRWGRIHYYLSYVLMIAAVILLFFAFGMWLRDVNKFHTLRIFIASVLLLSYSIYYTYMYRKYLPYFSPEEIASPKLKDFTPPKFTGAQTNIMCFTCKQPIVKREELTSAQYGAFWVLPHHKQCHMSSLKKSFLASDMIVNSSLFSMLTVISLLAGIVFFLLFFASLRSDPQPGALLLVALATFFPIQRIYSYLAYEQRLN